MGESWGHEGKSLKGRLGAKWVWKAESREPPWGRLAGFQEKGFVGAGRAQALGGPCRGDEWHRLGRKERGEAGE